MSIGRALLRGTIGAQLLCVLAGSQIATSELASEPPTEGPEPVPGDITGDGQPVRERVPLAA